MFEIYLLLLGAALAVMGTIELIMSERAFRRWKAWIRHRLFFIHGGLLIILGLPLACLKPASLPTAVFVIGLAFVFTGPFILLYADRLRKVFLSTVDDLDPRSIKGLMLADGLVRIAAGVILMYGSGILTGV